MGSGAGYHLKIVVHAEGFAEGGTEYYSGLVRDGGYTDQL